MKKVVVVGGGPAGLEAARTAAERGHQVVLFERQAQLGGQVNIATKVANRQELGGVVRYLAGQVAKLGVAVRLGQEADVAAVLGEQPDAVVVATGSEPIVGGEPGRVLSVWDVLEARAPVGQRVLVVDGGEGFWQCCATAEYLAEQGKQVEVITRLLYLGLEIPQEGVPGLYQRLLGRGAKITPLTALKSIEDDRVVVYHSYTKEERELRDVDTVVLAIGSRAKDDLYRALKRQVAELYAIGDAYAPRQIGDAIREGHRIGRTL